VEILDRDELITRLRVDTPGIPERASFFIMLLVEQGIGIHVVDFEAVNARPARLILVHPGQVQT
jgi:hypothetical protein